MRNFLFVVAFLLFVSAAFADRTAITATTLTSNGYPTDGVLINWQDGDEYNGLTFTLTRRKGQALMVHNYGGTTVNVSVSSVADDRGRTGNIETDAIVTGQTHIYGPFEDLGWNQGSGAIWFSVDTDNVSISVLTLP